MKVVREAQTNLSVVDKIYFAFEIEGFWVVNDIMVSWNSIQALLSAPNPDDPLSENIAKHWKTNETEAVETGICLLPL